MGWDYTKAPSYRSILEEAHRSLLADIHGGRWDAAIHCPDSRATHARLYARLAPPGHPYFAGNYRGARFEHLRRYEVTIGGRPGAAAMRVEQEMRRFHERVTQVAAVLDEINADGSKTPGERLALTATFIAQLLSPFLLIHPYADGNGHMSRFLVVSLFARFKHRTDEWTIDPRPPDPPYTNMIVDAHHGKPEVLAQYLIKCVLTSQPPQALAAPTQAEIGKQP